MRRSFLFGTFLLFSLTSMIALAQRGAVTRPSTLEQLTGESQLIVHGFVVSSKVEPHPKFPNLSTVVVEMKVVDILKGSAPERFSYRQFIWDIRDRVDGAGYRKGQELVLLLNAPSDLGLRSPVGLEQGRFVVQKGPDGRVTAVNGTGNAFLFKDFSSAFPLDAPAVQKKSTVAIPSRLRTAPRSLTVDDLKQLVAAYEGGR
jgi:hypothetical protein